MATGCHEGNGRKAWPEGLFLVLAFLSCLLVARRFSTDVAGGADSYGYVSEAVRLSQGRLFEAEKVLSPFGVPEDARLTHPLGYLEKGREGTVPAYPFGYPLLMALPIALFGVRAAFWVTPLLAAGAVLLTYALGRACVGRVGGALAAGLLAVLPTFLWGAFQPLSDVPATFFAALALVALLAAPSRGWADALLGSALGIAFWVRPNMALLAVVVFAFLALRRQWGRLGRAALALAPFLIVEGLANWYMFGAAWRTGYGAMSLDLRLGQAIARGSRHLLRLNAQQAGVGLALFAAAILLNQLGLASRLVLGSVFGAFLGFFAFYGIDDAWWYFRFLLPGVPAVAVMEAGLAVRLAAAGRWRLLRASVVAVGFCVVLVGSLLAAQKSFVFHAADDELRYPVAAAFVARNVGAPALVLAMQHSGSLRFYTCLPTARYDLRSEQELRTTLDRLAQAGANVYLVAERGELDWIRRIGRGFLLDHAALVGTAEPGGVSLFRLDGDRFGRRQSEQAAGRNGGQSVSPLLGDTCFREATGSARMPAATSREVENGVRSD